MFDERQRGNMQMLKDMKCIPCRGGEPQVTQAEAEELLLQLPKWKIKNFDDVNRLQRVYEFADFKESLSFTNRVAEFAEQQDHHPAILTEWGKVTVSWWTYIIKGLHINDFVSAVKTEQLYISNSN